MYYETFEKLCNERKCSVSTVSKETGIASSTLSEWKKGSYTPKNDKLQKIADFFGVSMDFLTTGKDVEKESTSGKKYYFSDATAQKAQELFENPELRVLFDAAQDSKPENLELAAEMLRRFKGES